MEQFPSSGDRIFHNNFIGNAIQAYDLNGVNQWDGGYPCGGNYWSDYTGADVHSGINQNLPGSDGIGDTPYDISGGSNMDTYPLMLPHNGTGPIPPDTSAPISSVNSISPRWYNTSPITVTAIASDSGGGVAYVEFWYRFAVDNGSWGAWEKIANDSTPADGWSVAFDFPNGQGYYELCSRAGDNAGNYEPAHGARDAQCGYDTSAPASSASPINPPITDASTLPIVYVMNDTLSGVRNVTLSYSYSSDGTSYGGWQVYGTESLPSTFIPFNFSFPQGDGFYQLYTRATDIAGNGETAPPGNDTWVCRDSAPPISYVSPVSPYWCNNSQMTVNATASDTGGGNVANVALWFRFCSYNSTWSAWTLYGLDTTAPWNWTFNFTDGQGYYEFYSISNDTANNAEAPPSAADAASAYDCLPPGITDGSAPTGTTGDPYTFRATVADNIASLEVRGIYWFGTGGQTNASMAHIAGNDYELAINVPLNSVEPLHYILVAVDLASNWNSTMAKDVLIHDNDAPVANAGPDQNAVEGDMVTLNGSGSTDNIGIVDYTWRLADGVVNVTLHGASPSHNFTTPGNYTVTLEVRDAAGNSDLGTTIVAIRPATAVDTSGDGVPHDEMPPAQTDRSIYIEVGIALFIIVFAELLLIGKRET